MYNWNSLTLAAHHFRRKQIVKKFDKRGRGTRTKCAFALHVAPSTVSNVLIGTNVSPRILTKLDNWIDEQNNSK